MMMIYVLIVVRNNNYINSSFAIYNEINGLPIRNTLKSTVDIIHC